MPVCKHLHQTGLGRPSQQRIHNRATRQTVFYAVREAGLVARFGTKLMAMDPLRHWTFDLLVYKEAVLLVVGVEGEPSKRADPQLDATARLDPAGFPNNANRRKCRSQQRQRVFALMERKNLFDRRVDDHTALKDRHDLSLTTGPTVRASPESAGPEAPGPQEIPGRSTPVVQDRLDEIREPARAKAFAVNCVEPA
jgi:hypothetical protein